MHHGVDFGGTFDVLAAGDGIIHHVGWSPTGGGHVVIIKHAPTVYTVYYHGKERTLHNKGDRIRQGDKIYLSGNTGASNGNHLHFELRKSPKCTTVSTSEAPSTYSQQATESSTTLVGHHEAVDT